jgi:hypothetical protein
MTGREQEVIIRKAIESYFACRDSGVISSIYSHLMYLVEMGFTIDSAIFFLEKVFKTALIWSECEEEGEE